MYMHVTLKSCEWPGDETKTTTICFEVQLFFSIGTMPFVYLHGQEHVMLHGMQCPYGMCLLTRILKVSFIAFSTCMTCGSINVLVCMHDLDTHTHTHTHTSHDNK